MMKLRRKLREKETEKERRKTAVWEREDQRDSMIVDRKDQLSSSSKLVVVVDQNHVEKDAVHSSIADPIVTGKEAVVEVAEELAVAVAGVYYC